MDPREIKQNEAAKSSTSGILTQVTDLDPKTKAELEIIPIDEINKKISNLETRLHDLTKNIDNMRGAVQGRPEEAALEASIIVINQIADKIKKEINFLKQRLLDAQKDYIPPSSLWVSGSNVTISFKDGVLDLSYFHLESYSFTDLFSQILSQYPQLRETTNLKTIRLIDTAGSYSYEPIILNESVMLLLIKLLQDLKKNKTALEEITLQAVRAKQEPAIMYYKFQSPEQGIANTVLLSSTMFISDIASFMLKDFLNNLSPTTPNIEKIAKKILEILPEHNLQSKMNPIREPRASDEKFSSDEDRKLLDTFRSFAKDVRVVGLVAGQIKPDTGKTFGFDISSGVSDARSKEELATEREKFMANFKKHFPDVKFLVNVLSPGICYLEDYTSSPIGMALYKYTSQPPTLNELKKLLERKMHEFEKHPNILDILKKLDQVIKIAARADDYRIRMSDDSYKDDLEAATLRTAAHSSLDTGLINAALSSSETAKIPPKDKSGVGQATNSPSAKAGPKK